jgi:O-antigen/teichoic acid export membrane protein
MKVGESSVGEFSLLAGSVAALQASRFAYSLLVADGVPRADFALWALLAALVGYAPAFLLGVLNGMARELPILTGSSRPRDAESAEAATWWTGLGVIVGLVAGGGVVAAFSREPAPVLASTLALGAAVVFQIQQFTLRSTLRFNRSGAQQLTLAVAIGVAGAYVATNPDPSFTTAAVAFAVSQIVAVAIGFLLRAPATGRFKQPMFRRLLKVGVPIMLVGILFSFLVTADRWIATVVFGPAEAAPYALASIIGSAMLILPGVLAQQTYPRMAIAFGETGDPRIAFRMARRQNRIAILLAVPAVLAVGLGLIVLIPRLLPEYVDAVIPSMLLLLGLLALSAFAGWGNFLNVIGAQWEYLRMQALGLVIAIVLMLVGAGTAGLAGIALGASVAYLAYGVLLEVAARRHARSGRVPAMQ